jgi:hypothetical protein
MPIELRLTARDLLRRRLVGTAIDPSTGEAVEDLEIVAQYPISPCYPDPLEVVGQHFVLDLLWEDVRVIVGAPDRVYWVRHFEGDIAHDYVVDVPLPVARRLTVRVLDGLGRPVQSAVVSISRAAGEGVIFHADWHIAYGRTDRAGRLVAERLPPELLTLTARRAESAAAASELSSKVVVDLTRDDCPDTVDIVLRDAH